MKQFQSFLDEHFVMALSVVDGQETYSAPLFYIRVPDRPMLVFSSDQATTHMRAALSHPRVSGCIYGETENLQAIQGVQFTGYLVSNPTAVDRKAARLVYYQRFPYARLKPAPIWLIWLDWVKWTDNAQGFGHKEVWSNPAECPGR